MAQVQKWTIERRRSEKDSERFETYVRSVSDPSLQFVFHSAENNGIPMMTCLPQSRFDKIDRGIRYRGSDVMISVYPKCGTTWCEQIVLLLLNGGNADLLNPVIKSAYSVESKYGKIWPEAMILNDVEERGGQFFNLSWEDFDQAPEPRVLKSHMPVNLLFGTQGRGLAALPDGMKVIVVGRNPFDACVSSYYFAFNPFKSGWPFEAWATFWMKGEPHFGNYFAWVREWYREFRRHEAEGSILWLSYEQLKADPLAEIARIARFLQIPQANDEKFISRVKELSSFQQMKRQAAEKGGEGPDPHLRKGIVGDWKNHFSKELFEDCLDHAKRELRDVPVIDLESLSLE